MNEPEWLREHRRHLPYTNEQPPDYAPGRLGHPEDKFQPVPDDIRSNPGGTWPYKMDPLERVKTAFNDHAKNTGEHVSPYDTGTVQVGVDGLEVQLLQGVDMDRLKQVVYRAKRATIGWPAPLPGHGPFSPDVAISDEDWQEMFRGGLQAALESQTVVFEVWGASRVLTHQLVRSRRAGFHQQSQRSTWYGDRPEVRMPETVWRAGSAVRTAWNHSYLCAWDAYRLACEAGVPYEDARYILPEGTVNYIQCEYTIREFINVFAYRGCSMFLREMVTVMRLMRSALLAQAPEIAPFIKISCETGKGCGTCKGTGKTPDSVPGLAPHYGEDCPDCGGTGGRRCTFQGWENVELACEFPWARENNRTFLATPRLRIGAK